MERVGAGSYVELGARLREVRGNADIPAIFVLNESSLYVFEWANEQGCQSLQTEQFENVTLS